MKLLCVRVFLLVVAFCQNAQGNPIESTFDTGADGWRVENAPSSWMATGGNPGGYLRADDGANAGTHLVAPAKFLGDLSPFNGGQMVLDLQAIRQPGAAGFPWTAQIFSSRISASRTIDEFPYPTDWESYTLPLVASAWGATESQWRDLLSNVTDIRLVLDATTSGFDAVGLDNFRIGIPEPSTVFLAVIGIMPFMRSSFSKR